MKGRESLSAQAMADKISSQHGKQPDATNVAQGTTIEFVWNLNDGDSLGFDIGMDMVLVNKALIARDAEAAQAIAARGGPKVKF